MHPTAIATDCRRAAEPTTGVDDDADAAEPIDDRADASAWPPLVG